MQILKNGLVPLGLLAVWLFSSGAGCSTKNNDPQPATAPSVPKTLSAFDTYLIGTWDFQTSTITFKKDGKSNGLTKSADYSYSYVFSKDHTFLATIAIKGPTGFNVETVSGRWSTSTTEGSKPVGSFHFLPFSSSPSGSTQPSLPLSFILEPTSGGKETCYVVFFNGNDMAFDWLSTTGQSETWEVWTKLK